MSKKSKLMRILDRIAGFIIVTVMVVAVCFLAIGKVMIDGPSEALNKQMKNTFLETRRFTFIPYIYLDAEEVDQWKYSLTRDGVAASVTFDENLINLDSQVVNESGEDAYGLVDEDGDGIIYQQFTYKGSTVYMLISLDPKRVFVGSAVQDPDQQWGTGKTLDDLINEYDALGGINAGGFVDADGAGSGWPPDGIMYAQGTCYNFYENGPVAALDHNGVLHVGYLSYEDCELTGVTDAVTFGPVLIINGEQVDSASLGSGINPRTAIGQRADGAIILMVVDGRQAYSIGLSFSDCSDLLYSYGCVNAINMDGGNSSCMYYNGELVNNPTGAAGGTRYLPEAWLIRK